MRFKFLDVKELGSQYSEKILHNGFVEAVALPRNALVAPLLFPYLYDLPFLKPRGHCREERFDQG